MVNFTDNVPTQKPDFVERMTASIARWARKHRISATALAIFVIASSLPGQPPHHPFLSPIYLAVYLAVFATLYLRHVPIDSIPCIALGFTAIAVTMPAVGFWIADATNPTYAALIRTLDDTGIAAAFRAINAVWMGSSLLIKAWAKESVAHLEDSSADEKRVRDIEEGGGHEKLVDEKQGLYEEEEAERKGAEGH